MSMPVESVASYAALFILAYICIGVFFAKVYEETVGRRRDNDVWNR